MVVALAVLYAMPCALAFRASSSPDVWWHLRVGQWVLEHHAAPWADPFSLYANDRPFIAYSWLFEVVIYSLYHALGPWGLIAYVMAGAIGVTVGVHRLIRMARPPMVVELLLLLGWAITLTAYVTARAWFVSMAAFVIEVGVLLAARRRPRLLWVLPVVFAVWANVHIVFVYGLVLLALAAAEPVIDRLTGRNTSEAPAPLGTMLLVLAVSTAATLLNPYHVRVYLAVRDFWRARGQFDYINELVAPQFRTVWDWVVLAAALAATFALARMPRLRAFFVMLLALAVAVSFRSQHHSWMVVVVAAVMVPAVPWSGLGVARLAVRPIDVGAIAGLVLVIMLATVAGRGVSTSSLQTWLEKPFPAAAVRVIKERGYRGPLYNDLDWGSYLIWALPELPVSIDGRTYLQGDRRILRSIATWSGQPDWDLDPELAAARLVVARRTSSLAGLLRRDSKFEMVHEDELAAVFVRK